MSQTSHVNMHLNYCLQYKGDQRKDKYNFRTREVN